MTKKLKLRIAIALLELAGIAVWHLMRLRKEQTPDSIYEVQEAANRDSVYLVGELKDELRRIG